MRLQLVALLIAAELPAQAATLVGTVTSADKTPVEHARISVIGTTYAVVAGVDGRFRFAGLPAGTHKIDVRMLGYLPIELSVPVFTGETMHVDVVLTANPAKLETVEVVSDAGVTPGMRGFLDRREHGHGRYITREEILRMQPRVFTDILRRVPGLQIRAAPASMSGNMSVQARGAGCPVLFFLNGTAFPVPPELPINHYVSAEDVVAVEVYTGSSSIPAEFNSSLNAKCGVIVVWTRHGPEGPRKR